MFENLSSRLSRTIHSLRGHGRLTDDQIKVATRELRVALLEADVALPVVRNFIERVRARAVGSEVSKSLTPGEAVLRIVQQELIATMGGQAQSINLRVQPPAVILMAGLQGSGKTTSTAKLALRLKEMDRKQVVVVSTDVYRPAAIDQLRMLSEQVSVDCFPSTSGQDPIHIVREALTYAKKRYADVLIVDTAGRTAVDEKMMREVAALHNQLKPIETMFVVDAMTGQDAATVAHSFGEVLPLTGVILTKADGDARGGAALSVREVTGAPIKFIGVGEKLTALEVFHPDRIAARILGQGDIQTLIEETSRKVDQDRADMLARKLRSKKNFTLEDFREQMVQVQNLGSVDSLLEKLPGGLKMQSQMRATQPENAVRKAIAIINSMTPQERHFPELIKASRKRRIAAGAGLEVQEINRLLRQYEASRDMMKKFASGGMNKMMRSLAGRFPRGIPPGSR